MRVSSCSLLTLALTTLAIGCDSRSSAQTQGPAVEVREVELESPFPDAATVADLAAQPAPAAELLYGPAVADVDTWTMAGDAPTSVQSAVWAGDDRNAKVAAQVLADDSTGRRLTQGMQCLAEQVGRFVLANDAAPPSDVEAFMAARCGTPVASPRISVVDVAASGAKPLNLERDRARLESLFGATAPGASLGMFKGRDRAKGKAVEVVASGMPEVELSEPVALAGHSGEVVLAGTLAWDFETVRGWATQGAQGVVVCTPSEPLVSPGFSLRCPVAAGDGATMIELVATPRGALPERRVLRVLATGAAEAPSTYQAAALPVPAGAARDEAGLVATVNALRQASQLAPVAGAPAQSTVLGSLLPHHVAAAADPARADVSTQAELGMIVGLEIDGDLMRGGVMVSKAPSSRPLERELAAALASPWARGLVLDPQAAHLAFTSSEDATLGMRVSGLAIYTEPSAEADGSSHAAAYLDALDRQRGASGLPPVVRGEDPADLQTMQTTIDRVYAEEIGPAQALDDLLRYIATKTQLGFKGRIEFPLALDGWSPTFSGALLEADEVTVMAAVGRMKVGDGWGRPMVVVLYEAKEPAPETAEPAEPGEEPVDAAAPSTEATPPATEAKPPADAAAPVAEPTPSTPGA